MSAWWPTSSSSPPGARPTSTTSGSRPSASTRRARTVEVDDRLRCGRDGLWAIGDITGKGAFTHVAMYQSAIALRDLLDQDGPPASYHALPHVTFTDPEVGGVGMSEQQARDAGLSVRVGTVPLEQSSRGFTHGPGARGLIKVVEDADRGVLVGATAVGPAGGEILGFLAVAVHAAVPVSDAAHDDLRLPDLPPRHRERPGGPRATAPRARRRARQGPRRPTRATGSTGSPAPVWSRSGWCTWSSGGWRSSWRSATARAARRAPARSSSWPSSPSGRCWSGSSPSGWSCWRVAPVEAALGYRDEDDPARVQAGPSGGKAVVYATIAVTAFSVATGSSGGGSGGGGTDTFTAQADGPAWRPAPRRSASVSASRRRGRATSSTAWRESYLKKVDTDGRSGHTGTAYRVLGRAGYGAKGVALGVVGGLFRYAAVTHEAKKSGGLDQALTRCATQSSVRSCWWRSGLGFAAYGLYCFVQARYLDR